MRIAIALIPFCLGLAPVSSQAAKITSDLALACSDLDHQKRISRVGARDKDAMIEMIRTSLASGACVVPPKDSAVRVDETSFPFACVAKMGSTAPCRWIEMRHVDVRQ